jgi:hypothetical protein
MALGTELFSLATSFDPYGAMRKGQMAPQAYDVEQQKLDLEQQKMGLQKQAIAEQQKETKADQAKTPELAQMSQNILGNQFVLQDSNGVPTDSGLLNQEMVTLKTDLQQAQKLAQQEKYFNAIGDTKSAQVAGMESRRYLTQSKATGEKINQIKTKSYDDFYNNLYGAKSQADYEERIKSGQERSGAPLPPDLPKTWTPEIKDKLKSKMSMATRTALDKDERAETSQQYKDLQIKDLTRKIEAAERDDPIKYGILQAQLNKLQRLGAGGEGDVKDIKKLGPKVRNIANEFGADPSQLIGMETKDKAQVGAAHTSLNSVESIADFIDKHPDAVGTLASVTKKFGSKTENFIDNLQKDDVANNLSGDAALLSKMLTTQALNDVTASVGGRVNQMLEKRFMDNIYDQSLSKDTLKRVLAQRQVEAAKVLDEYGIDATKGDKNKYKFFSSQYEKSRTLDNKSVTAPDGKTYTRPPNFTDKQWEDYQKAMGAKK